MRALVKFIDRLLRRSLGVYEFTDDPHGLLRIQITTAPHPLQLPGGDVQEGEPVLGLHLWNEHMPRIPPNGPDVAWGLTVQRRFVQSLRAVAREMQRDPRLAGVRAVGATTGAIVPGEASSGRKFFEHLGFKVVTYRRRRFRAFAEFWENFYSWWLMWAYNPASLRHRRFSDMARTDLWIAPDEFLNRYGPKPDQEP